MSVTPMNRTAILAAVNEICDNGGDESSALVTLLSSLLTVSRQRRKDQTRKDLVTPIDVGTKPTKKAERVTGRGLGDD